MNPGKWVSLCALLVVVGITGCAMKMLTPSESGAAGAGSSHTHVIIGETDYYKGGPQQSSPPDGQFAKGTKVTLIRRAGSYSLVRSENGVQAYVSTGSIRAAD
jgi:hypothetical protein